MMFDSGTTFINLNKKLAEQIYADLNAKLDSGLGYYLVDCATRDMEGGLVIGFGDVSILISFNDLIFTAGGLCAVGVQGSDEGLQQILGVPFFRASYSKLQTASRAPAVIQTNVLVQPFLTGITRKSMSLKAQTVLRA